MLAIILILVGILMRFMPHAPNFTPVAAIALFGGAYLGRRYSIVVPLALMAASDFVIGLHNVVFFTWGCFIVIALMGNALKSRKKAPMVAAASIGSSFLFYLVTNFGVWLMGWYPHSLRGLIDCYILGLPFLRDFTLATLVYSAVFFGSYELVARLVKNTKYSRILLAE